MLRSFRHSTQLLASIAGSVFITLASNASAESLTDPTPVSGWIVTVRANAGYAANYDGSKGVSPYALPGLGMRRPDTPVSFSAPDESPGFALYDNGFFKAGLTGQLRTPRSSAIYTELHGIHDIDWTIEAGGFAEFWTFNKLRARVELRHAFLEMNGDVADFYLDWVEKHGAWTFSLGPRLTLADQPYMNKLFGVTAYEAMVNGVVTPFSPSSGAKSVGLTGSITYKWSETWSTSVYGKYYHLVGEAATSPIPTKLGSANQFTCGLSVAYSFNWNGF
jgi:outer membrane scaffolding protein for murein synthesis (MipA/OmpV family)